MCADPQYHTCTVYWCFPETESSLCLCCKLNLYTHSEYVWKFWTSQMRAQTSPVPRQRKFLDRKGRTDLRKSRCTLAIVKIETKTENTPNYHGQCLATFSFFGKRWKTHCILKKYYVKFSSILFPFVWQKFSEWSYTSLSLLFPSYTVLLSHGFLECLSNVFVIVFLILFQFVLIKLLFKWLVKIILF